MAFRHRENYSRSVGSWLEGVEYPAPKEEIVRTAEDSEASVDIINLLKSLPRERYASLQEAQRDLAEAGRRFGMGNQPAEDDGARRDRRNIGRDAVEGAPPGMTRHP